jgi:hypothetical protein
MTTDWKEFTQTLESVVQRGVPTHLQIAGSGSLSIYPHHDCYTSDIRDWRGAAQVSASQITSSPSPWGAPPEVSEPLRELRWRAAIDAASAETGEGEGAGPELLLLDSWPDLTGVPDVMLGSVARICALLWRKPTVGFLVARTLQMPAREVAVLLRVLRSLGHVTAHSATATTATRALPEVPAGPDPAGEYTMAPPAPVPSVLSKFWQRLLGAQPA